MFQFIKRLFGDGEAAALLAEIATLKQSLSEMEEAASQERTRAETNARAAVERNDQRFADLLDARHALRQIAALPDRSRKFKSIAREALGKDVKGA